MCDCCNSTRCPPFCPSYEGRWEGMGRAVGRCALCEEALGEGERVLERDGELLCESCVRSLEVEDLLVLEGVKEMREILQGSLGWLDTRL